MDPEDDFSIEGSQSANFTYQSRALVYCCENRGSIAAGKRVSGGIAGQLTLGTVLKCENYGLVEGRESAYIGGIAGSSRGTVDTCFSKCRVTGQDYVGGICGEGKTIINCLAMVELENTGAYTGAIAGSAMAGAQVTENRFLRNDPLAGLDGISYQGVAEPISYRSLLKTEDLPEYFRKIHITFVDDNGVLLKEEQLTYGQSLLTLPALPTRPGYSTAWEDFDEKNLTLDHIVHAVYTPLVTVLRAEKPDVNAPEVLVEGNFDHRLILSLTGDDSGWQLTLPENGSHTLRVKPQAEGNYLLELKTPVGWTAAGSHPDGSYLVCMTEGTDITFRLVTAAEKFPVLPTVTAVLLAVSGLGLLWKKKIKKAK